ncbi:hypothetical protein EPH_0000170 [Eimeria praecox]|uniref:Uncharacterized protein n=1 Tax=Eimeria praecox TaxID=51316 RepID=U6H8A0_9EIME|nr:hypothetical protein EPH_0000170 [Eimeria praecox]
MQAHGLLPRVHGAGRDPSLPLHQQLEAAAAEVLCCTYIRDWKQLQQLLPHALQLAAASLDPRSAAAVRECGARLLLELHLHPDLQLQQQEEQQQQEQQQQQQQPWADIHAHLMAAFRHHQEVGDTRAAAAALRRAVLAAPLAASSVDPFSTREGKALQGDPEVQSAKALRAAFEASDVSARPCFKPFGMSLGLRRLRAISCCYSAFPLQRLEQALRLSEEDTRKLLLQLRQPEEVDAASAAELLDQWRCCVGQLAAHLEESFPEEPQDKPPLK